MLDELLAATPRTTLEVVVTERFDQRLRLVQPRGVRRREARSPPVATRPVSRRIPCRVAGVVVLDEEYPLQASVSATKRFQLPNVVLRVLFGFHGHLHPAGVDDEKEQQVDCPMPLVLKLLLLDGTRNRSADRATFQNLMVGHLIRRYRPDALASQPFRIGIAPENLLRPVLELGVEAGGLPVTGAVRLQVHISQDSSDRARADVLDDAVSNGLACQFLAGPVGDVQAFGDGLQTGQFDNLGSL